MSSQGNQTNVADIILSMKSIPFKIRKTPGVDAKEGKRTYFFFIILQAVVGNTSPM